MAICPSCNKKIALWRLHPLVRSNVKFFVICACGTQLKAKHWLSINIVMFIIGIFIFWLFSNFNISPAFIIFFLLFFIVFFPPFILNFMIFKNIESK